MLKRANQSLQLFFYAQDPGALANFYCDVLGFPFMEKVAEDGESSWVCVLSGLQIVISGKLPGLPEKKVRIQLQVLDLDAFVSALAAVECEPLYPITDLGFARQTAVSDPIGNLIELQEMAVASVDRVFSISVTPLTPGES